MFFYSILTVYDLLRFDERWLDTVCGDFTIFIVSLNQDIIRSKIA